MGRTTKTYKFPYPVTGDPADGPAAFQKLAEKVEEQLAKEIHDLNSDLRTYVGSAGGKVSMRSYVDTRDQDLIRNYKKLIGDGDDDVIAAYKKADTKLETDLTAAYTTALTKTAQMYPGNIVSSFGAVGPGEKKNVSGVLTIPASTWRRILVVQAGGLWTAGYGDISIKLNGTVRRSGRARDPNESLAISVAFELATGTSYTLQLEATGAAPNSGSTKINDMTTNDEYTYLTAHTVMGGG